MPFFIPLLLIGAVGLLAALGSEQDLEDQVALVGPTSAGKSLLGNELVDDDAFSVAASHGTTTEAKVFPFEDGWSIADTPGILDGEALSNIALKTAARSRVIVFCVDGELYNPVFRWLETLIGALQTSKRVVIIPYLTKEDLREAGMPSADRLKIRQRIERQMKTLRDTFDDRPLRIADLMLGRPGDRDELLEEIRDAMAWAKA